MVAFEANLFTEELTHHSTLQVNNVDFGPARLMSLNLRVEN